MSNSPQEGEKDRLDSEEFVDLIPHLPFGNLLDIEFYSNDWKRLIATVDAIRRLYKCNLCNIIQPGHKSVASHITGKKHIGNMCIAKYFYHPEYTFTKSQLLSNDNNKKDSRYNDKKTTSSKLASDKNPEIKLDVTSNNVKSKSQVKNTSQSTVAKAERTKNDTDTVDQLTKGKQDANIIKSTIQNKSKDSVVDVAGKLIEMKNTSNKETSYQTGPKDMGLETKKAEIPDMKTEKGKNMPSVRVVPLAKLQETEKVKANPNSKVCEKVSVDVRKEQCAAKISKEKKSETDKSKMSDTEDPDVRGNKCVASKSLNTNSGGIQNLGIANSGESAQSKAEETLTAKVTNSTHAESKNVDLTSSEISTNMKSQKGTQDSSLSNNENRFEKSAGKLVKNPLAGKPTHKNISVEKSESEASKSANMPEVLVIDDSDDEAQPVGKCKVHSVIKKPEPTPKKLTLSVSKEPYKNDLYDSANTNSSKALNVKEISILKSKTGCPKSLSSKVVPLQNNKKTTEEPAFAKKSVTDSLSGDTIHGFVGVEYVIKILRSEATAKFECGLCELIVDGPSMQNHLLGYTHRLKFCEKHFPTAIQQFRQYIVNVPPDEHYKVMIPILKKLCCAIEEHHGRSLPYDCNERRYNMERHRVLTEVFARRHASEQKGPTFTHVVDSKEVDKFVLQKDNLNLQSNKSHNIATFDRPINKDFGSRGPTQISNRHLFDSNRGCNQNFIPYNNSMMQPNITSAYPIVSDNAFMDDETHKRMVENFLKANSKGSFSHQNPSRSGRYERDDRKLHTLKRPHSPPRKNFDNNKKEGNSSLNIWSSYCRLVDTKLKSLREHFQQYRTNPESHPSYKDEWLKFWHRRKAELMAAGKDYRTYDFQPDWVPFFNNRINELYDEAFEKIKIEAREELSLPMTNNCLHDPKYFVHISIDSNSPPIKKSIQTSSQVDINSHLNSGALPSPYSKKERTTSNTCRQPVRMDDDRTMLKSNEIHIQEESTPTVVSVLRLLTALEEHLGSLGPKIVDLLSKALQAEKANQGRAQVLLTEENCTLLETAMEKFKGLVIAGILDTPKERALKKAISKVDALLEYTKEINEKHPSAKQAQQVSNINNKNVGNIDYTTINRTQSEQNVNDKLKQALQSVSNASDISKVIHLIEEKIAASLKAQGRTDVNRAHLEQLAAVCVLLEKKKREVGNVEKQDFTAPNAALQQPLSDTLKKIVGSISENATEQRSQQITSSQHFSVNRDIQRMQERHPKMNTDEINIASNSSNPQGNFSNVYSKNNYRSWMGDNQNYSERSQPHNWQQQQQQQQQYGNNVAYPLGWAQYPNRTEPNRGSWGADERGTASGRDSQRSGYNFGNLLGQGQFRHN